MKKLIFAATLFASILLSNNVEARTNVTDWYIKDFQSEIVVNKNSTLLITEKITADCGSASGKHGIFRTLPTVFRSKAKTIAMPIELSGITDFKGNSLKYSTQTDYSNKTVTWKIGDPDRTVMGENNYLITYKVKNAILFDNPDFDEFYWNLNGNFWDLEADSFTGKIVFPAEVTKSNAQVDYYTGSLNSKGKDGASYSWLTDNILQFKSNKTLLVGEGITASITFPKNIIMPYVPTFWEKYALYLWLIIPLIALAICFSLWDKYGKDPEGKKTIIAEFDIPEKLSPLELGALYTNGKLKTEFISASIINLAVKKVIQIEQIEGLDYLNAGLAKEGISKLSDGQKSFADKALNFFHIGEDFRLKIINRDLISELASPEKILIQEMFGAKDEIMLSSLKNEFYKSLPEIKKITIKSLEDKKLIEKAGLNFQFGFLVIGGVLAFLTFFLANYFLLSLPAMILTTLLVFIFAIFMPKRTLVGAEVFWKTKGFRLYMETAEKYREQFNEKENIFEKLLPYAIMFGMTKLWIKKMKEIYGEDYFNSYHPMWFVGGSMANFDADSFASRVDSLSSAMASNVSSGSGAGGGGGSGGGGGGGGGGGW
ncbi:MAG: DUF2207 domain-containing protein [Candidatus Moraniibacteriota bacterium]